MSKVVISVEELSKLYRLGSIGSRTLRDDVHRWWARARGKADPLLRIGEKNRRGDGERIWAIKDLSFEIYQGDIVGVIGRNGAGKSTLLKILSRITAPTTGQVRIKGRIASLLEVGTGFHPELTGRENIYLSGAILGMRRQEIERKFDEIVDFSGVEEFIDTPVKRYSSGMGVRLGFAVAAHLEPEILLVDVVLAVGDAEFQKKCLGKMGAVAQQGRTILFVSHNMGAIARLCKRGFWIDDGALVESGDARDVVSKYLTSDTKNDGIKVWPEGIANPGEGHFGVTSVSILDSGGHVTSCVDAQKPFRIVVDYEVKRKLPPCRVGILLSTADGTTAFEAYDADHEQYMTSREAGVYSSECIVPAHLLNPGRFTISVNAGIPHVRNLAWLQAVLAISVEDMSADTVGAQVGREGVIRPPLIWNVRNAAV